MTPYTKPLLVMREARSKGDVAALREMVRTAKRLDAAHRQWKLACADAARALDEVERRGLVIPEDMPKLLGNLQAELQDAEENALTTPVVVVEKCSACGAPRQAWQSRDETECMACGGTLGAELPALGTGCP